MNGEWRVYDFFFPYPTTPDIDMVIGLTIDNRYVWMTIWFDLKTVCFSLDDSEYPFTVNTKFRVLTELVRNFPLWLTNVTNQKEYLDMLVDLLAYRTSGNKDYIIFDSHINSC